MTRIVNFLHLLPTILGWGGGGVVVERRLGNFIRKISRYYTITKMSYKSIESISNSVGVKFKETVTKNLDIYIYYVP